MAQYEDETRVPHPLHHDLHGGEHSGLIAFLKNTTDEDWSRRQVRLRGKLQLPTHVPDHLWALAQGQLGFSVLELPIPGKMGWHRLSVSPSCIYGANCPDCKDTIPLVVLSHPDVQCYRFGISDTPLYNIIEVLNGDGVKVFKCLTCTIQSHVCCGIEQPVIVGDGKKGFLVNKSGVLTREEQMVYGRLGVDWTKCGTGSIPGQQQDAAKKSTGGRVLRRNEGTGENTEGVGQGGKRKAGDGEEVKQRAKKIKLNVPEQVEKVERAEQVVKARDTAPKRVENTLEGAKQAGRGKQAEPAKQAERASKPVAPRPSAQPVARAPLAQQPPQAPPAPPAQRPPPVPQAAARPPPQAKETPPTVAVKQLRVPEGPPAGISSNPRTRTPHADQPRPNGLLIAPDMRGQFAKLKTSRATFTAQWDDRMAEVLDLGDDYVKKLIGVISKQEDKLNKLRTDKEALDGKVKELTAQLKKAVKEKDTVENVAMDDALKAERKIFDMGHKNRDWGQLDAFRFKYLQRAKDWQRRYRDGEQM